MAKRFRTWADYDAHQAKMDDARRDRENGFTDHWQRADALAEIRAMARERALPTTRFFKG